MLKNILNLDGVQKLNKVEQKTVKGGIAQQECGVCEIRLKFGCVNVCL